MKAPFSTYLTGIAPGLKELIAKLEDSYDYVSILSTDSKGFAVRVSRHAKTVQGKTMTTERGNVVRVAKNGLYSEYAFRGGADGREDTEGAGCAAAGPHDGGYGYSEDAVPSG